MAARTWAALISRGSSAIAGRTIHAAAIIVAHHRAENRCIQMHPLRGTSHPLTTIVELRPYVRNQTPHRVAHPHHRLYDEGTGFNITCSPAHPKPLNPEWPIRL